MKSMNCKKAEELLPLYAGGDLVDETGYETGLLEDHLAKCERCEQSLSGYMTTSELLELYVPPQFTDAVYDLIRHNVSRQIGVDASKPTFFQLAATVFQPRFAVVASTVVLLTSVLLVYHFSANRRQIADAIPPPPQSTIPELTVALPVAPIGGPNDGNSRASNNGYHEGARRLHRKAKGGDRQALKRSGKSDDEVSPLRSPASGDPALTVLATAKEQLRMEIHTEDPNIRIIWFAELPAKRDSVN